MKKIISVLVFVLMLMTALTVFATAIGEDTSTYVYNIDDTEYTVIFENNNLSAQKQEVIAKKLIGIDNSDVQTYGLGCTLFGHDYTYNTVHVVTHKAKTYSPRCKQDTYDTVGCEDCDYLEQTLINTTYIACCPEE